MCCEEAVTVCRILCGMLAQTSNLQKGQRATSLTWSQLCLLLAQLVCCRRYICSVLLSNEDDVNWKDAYFLVTWGSVDQQWSAVPRDF